MSPGFGGGGAWVRRRRRARSGRSKGGRREGIEARGRGDVVKNDFGNRFLSDEEVDHFLSVIMPYPRAHRDAGW
jgi:hypothetical protein